MTKKLSPERKLMRYLIRFYLADPRRWVRMGAFAYNKDHPPLENLPEHYTPTITGCCLYGGAALFGQMFKITREKFAAEVGNPIHLNDDSKDFDDFIDRCQLVEPLL